MREAFLFEGTKGRSRSRFFCVVPTYRHGYYIVTISHENHMRYKVSLVSMLSVFDVSFSVDVFLLTMSTT